MNSMPCEREEELAEALRMERWPEGAPRELREHVAECPACTELALVASCLRRDAVAAEGEADLPEAGFVWWKARLVARRAATERAMRPVMVAQKAGLVAGALAAAGLAAWQWPVLKEWLGGPIFPTSSHSSLWMGLLAASLAGTLVVAGIGLYLIWSER
ncbi:MAG: hypothetical protein DMG21_11165 [Acidobacteria bacterium]|nr:MAG: hypothetical protein DMG21_11165 [Acidobacteriota bacterium]